MEVWLLLLGGTSHSSFIFYIYINAGEWKGGGILKGIRVSGLNEVI